MEAVRLKQIDRDYRNHLQAYLNFVVQAKRLAGKGKQKAVYGRFDRFYDYQNELDRASGSGEKKSRFAGLGQFLKKGG